jgi:acetyl esterase
MDNAPDTTESPAESPAPSTSSATAGPAARTRTRTRAKATKAASTTKKGAPARKRAAGGTAATARTGGGRTSKAAASPTHPVAEDGAAPGRPRRPFRSRALYNRRIQRTSEHWPLVTQLAAWLFCHPDLVMAVSGPPPRAEADGRVLNRGTQALLGLANRLEARTPKGPDDRTVYEPVAMRRQLTRLGGLAMPVRTDVHVTGRVIPGPEGAPSIAVRVYRQFGTGFGADAGRGGRPPAIVYYHGGGWVTGDLDSHDGSCRLLAAASGCIVVAVEYRLAPENPFPAAVDDAVAAYQWVQRHSDELGHAHGHVGVMGDSAGGNLAAVVALVTRPGEECFTDDVPPPVAQGLIYPVVDARLDTESVHSLGDGFFLTLESMEFFRSAYLPDSGQREEAKASPLLADHRGAAPALVVTAGFDPLRDDGANYAAALRSSGVEVEYRCYDDQVHGFMGMGFLPDSLALATEVCDAMGRLMRRSAPVADDG